MVASAPTTILSDTYSLQQWCFTHWVGKSRKEKVMKGYKYPQSQCQKGMKTQISVVGRYHHVLLRSCTCAPSPSYSISSEKQPIICTIIFTFFSRRFWLAKSKTDNMADRQENNQQAIIYPICSINTPASVHAKCFLRMLVYPYITERGYKNPLLFAKRVWKPPHFFDGGINMPSLKTFSITVTIMCR